jgi:hypothetical protein
LPADTPDMPLQTAADLKVLLATTINSTRRGELGAREANAIAGLSNVLLKAMTTADLETRLAAVEEELRRRKR